VNFDDPMLERGYDGMRAYAQSKLALVMFTFDLAGQLEGTGATAKCLHPATLMGTKMVFEAFGSASSDVLEGRRRDGLPGRRPGSQGGHGALLRGAT
jgi:NAD(P)-dependent dehydrogenase (short-subunit alcohol dehydrogenase family)